MRQHQYAAAAGVPPAIAGAWSRLLAEERIETRFAPDVLAEAAAAAHRPTLPTTDLTDLDFQTLDPAGSRDLDQAFYLEKRGTGYRVWYAIADVAAFVAPGGRLDATARRRGTTVYSPVARFPLHPVSLSKGAASLLADGQARPAAVWRIDLDADGTVVDADVQRALVRNRAQLAYDQCQSQLDAGRAGDDLVLLKRIGELRLAQETARGGISLNLPEQDIVTGPDGWRLSYRVTLPVEDWNAQLSLVTGNVAATMMLDAGTGILRTLPPADQASVDRLRHIAKGLGLAWPAAWPYARFVRSLDPTRSAGLAMMTACTTLFRGAGYTAFTTRPAQPEVHAALAMPYAHVTAPLRRLVDRFGTEVCLHHCAGTPVPDWVVAALSDLPELMAQADQRASGFERGAISLVEALVLDSHRGTPMAGVVVATTPHGARVRVADLAVELEVPEDTPRLGDAVKVVVSAVDLSTGQVTAALQ